MLLAEIGAALQSVEFLQQMQDDWLHFLRGIRRRAVARIVAFFLCDF